MFADIIKFVLLCAVCFIIAITFFDDIITRYTPQYYYVHHSERYPTFQAECRNILERSAWKSYRTYAPASRPELANIHIYLKHESFMTEKYGRDIEYYYDRLDQWGQPRNPTEKKGRRIHFSTTYYTDPKRPIIYINEANWAGCPESGLSLAEYREYVINHEFGHALGYDHQPCNAQTATDGRCPVMYQSTRGPPVGFLCGYQPTDVDHTKKLF
jgi:hypothetical protein